MSAMNFIKTLVIATLLLATGVSASAADVPTVGPAGVNRSRYATDAYPGFDDGDELVKPERKEPRWWWFMCGGPDCETAAEQMAHCRALFDAGDFSAARSQLDALVRRWPTAPEAAEAQLRLADVCLECLGDYEDAFAEYRYLLDFYSTRCDYAAVADRLYHVAGVLKSEGKEIMFVRFANTVDVRRAYEACVLRAPGASWAPEAMLTIAGLRVDEGKPAEALKVYENLRSLHAGTPEAMAALAREAEVRMGLLRDHGYNRARCLDTIGFLRMAREKAPAEEVEAISGFLAEAEALMSEEAYRGARFYDSPTRTKRSAISAYERFLADYPSSAHAEEVRARLAELKETTP